MLMRVYITMDQEHRIVLPAGIRKALGLEPGNKVALTMIGSQQMKQALLSKPKERKIHEKTCSRPRR